MKIEIGDWIECTYANGTRIVAQVSGENKIKENGIGQEFPTSFTEGSGWTSWKPREDEWCWMWSNNTNIAPVLRQFHKMRRSEYKEKDQLTSHQYCEPFFGKFPTFIKGN